MQDVVIQGHRQAHQRNQLLILTSRVSDDELEDAIALLEWLTDPNRRYLVEQLAGWSNHARRLAQHSSSV